jgi:hypothetical protein
MSEVFEHNPGDHEDPLTGPTWIIGFLGAVLLAVIMLGLTALVYTELHQEDQVKLVDKESKELEDLRTKQWAQLHVATPRWVTDPAVDETPPPVKRLVIPLEQAMEIVVKEAGGSK